MDILFFSKYGIGLNGRKTAEKNDWILINSEIDALT